VTTPGIGRPPGRDLGLMAVALVAVSTSGPLIAACTAPALAIAFWRNALAVGLIAPYSMLRRTIRAEIAGLSRRETQLAALAGLLLALHFATWVPSLRYTSVASSTALVATQPIWAALLARAFGQRIPGRAWVGIAVALVGVLVLTGVDVSVSASTLFGDVLALLGGIFAAAYVFAGAAVRATVSTTTYTLLCYSTCSVLLLAICLVGRVQLTGFSTADWLRILALTLGAQLLGHSLFNVVLRTTSPVVVSLAILFEMPGATLIAAVTLGQVPPPAVLPAAALLLVGVGLVITSSDEVSAIPAE
jgi:drug/metabolite transporter (DMT)-like permease